MFECKPCNFEAFKKSNYESHLETLKHKKNIEHCEDTLLKINKKYYCRGCQKVFKYKQKRWRHELLCVFVIEQESVSEIKITKLECDVSLLKKDNELLKKDNEILELKRQ